MRLCHTKMHPACRIHNSAGKVGKTAFSISPSCFPFVASWTFVKRFKILFRIESFKVFMLLIWSMENQENPDTALKNRKSLDIGGIFCRFSVWIWHHSTPTACIWQLSVLFAAASQLYHQLFLFLFFKLIFLSSLTFPSSAWLIFSTSVSSATVQKLMQRQKSGVRWKLASCALLQMSLDSSIKLTINISTAACCLYSDAGTHLEDDSLPYLLKSRVI